MLGSPAGPGGPTQRGGLWPLAPVPAPSTANFSAESFGKYGIYSLLPGSPAFGSALYSHSSIGRFATGSIQPSSGTAAFHAAHKVSDSIFTSTGYTFGAPTPPPGSPYSPVPVAQLELLSKGFNSNIIIQQQQHHQQQQPDFQLSPKKRVVCEEKCCSGSICGKTQQKLCGCQQPQQMSPMSAKTKFLDSPSGGGCSRTNPVDWSSVMVKKEPGATPCQVAEITTSESTAVKLEVTSPTVKVHHQEATTPTTLPPIVSTTGNIPVGIAVARQRIQQQQQHEVVSSPSLPPTGLLATVNTTQIKEVARISEIDAAAGMAATQAAATAVGVSSTNQGAVLQCPPDDRSHQAFANWPLGGGAHGSALATPTLWQYPAPLPMEPLVPMPLPMPPVGFQLVRDHNTGGLLLLPTTGVEQLQQTVVWPSYHQPSSHVLLPPLPPPPLQLLGSASSDYLQTSTTLHQHTQTHSTRLLAVTTDNKRKLPLPMPATTLIKIETDATLDQTKTVSALSNAAGTMYADQNMAPLVTTHLIYQHPTNLILSQTPDTECKATSPVACLSSPVACLTPPPEVSLPIEEETTVQDASNQTETLEEEAVVEATPVVEEEPVDEDAEEEKTSPDLSGLELLSNSIAEFEKLETEEDKKENRKDEVVEAIAQMTIADGSATSAAAAEEMGGLDLLCALAEQRIMEEEVQEEEENEERKRRRSVLKDMDEPEEKKVKLDVEQVKSCTCKEDAYKTYKTEESKEGVRKFLASKSQSLCCKGDWPCMNAMELDMRMRLADLQRKYREKQRELSRLKPKRQQQHDVKKSSRSRKKSVNSDRSTPPPLLDKMDAPLEEEKHDNQELLKPPTLCPYGGQEPPSECTSKSSKKRKVGRPKKLMSSSGCQTVTETIVAKKPKKGNLVGYLLAAKEKLVQCSAAAVHSDPPRFVEETTTTPVKTKKRKKSKIRPKLKAEPTIKRYVDEEDEELEDEDVVEEEEVVADTRCVLTTELLEEDRLRVLTAMGGLFYAGRLNAVEPPDVYSITLDGERGNRPHIMSREEILRDAIVEVSPSSAEELTPGTRLCAYWSQQYRCLYPGSVAEPETSEPHDVDDGKFVSVEFDDGDSGRIAIEDIRLLPPDYPIIEYDPNPLLSLSKRRRRTSTTDERRPASLAKSPTPTPEPPKSPDLEKENLDVNKRHDVESSSHKERKRLKKRKRDKLHDEKKRRKKHRCGEEHCKHRKHHKKHRKHKKHHHNKEPVVEEAVEEEEVVEIFDDEEEENEEEEDDRFPEYRVVANPEDEVTMDDVLEAKARLVCVASS